MADEQNEVELELGGVGHGGLMSMTMARSTSDEFVRAGDTLRLSLPAWMLWDRIHPDQGTPDVTRLQELDASVSVICEDTEGATVTHAAPKAELIGDEPYSLRELTTPVVVPANADRLRFAITIVDAADKGASAKIEAAEIAPVPVFGGALPGKYLFFDSHLASFHERTLPGGAPGAASEVTFAYTDWRADTVVDRMMIDTRIGTASYAGRFGWTTVAVYGKIAHEVSVGVWFDDGQGWRAEQPLAANAASRVLPPGRVAYEATLHVPASATKMSLYVHVKTYVVADYSGYQVTEKWYADGAKIFTRERWDNPHGPFTNYDYDLER